MKRINIVYFIWINPNKNYEAIISGQLNDMKKSGLLDKSKLYIEICCEHENLIENIKGFINKIIGEYIYEINFYLENKYEYYGIKKMYDLAILQPDRYYLYLHSKGMFNYDNIDQRHIYEKTLTKGTVYQCRKVIEIFKNHANISRIGLFPSALNDQNFIWLNFFWARGSYIITCENPIETSDRFYYERWSGTGERNSLVYNLHENNYKKYLLNEVGDILNELNGNYILN